MQNYHRKWQSVNDRFETERSHFDFRRLCFCDKDDDDAYERTTATESLTNASTSQEFTSALNLAPSQRLSQLAAAETRGSGRFRRLHLDMDSVDNVTGENNDLWVQQKQREEESRLDKLAVYDVGLVGRDPEIEILEGLFSSVSVENNTQHEHRPVKMCVVVGPSGSGKSALAMHLKAKVQSSGGLWCSGKFDLHNRADPYDAIVQALSMLIRNAESKPELKNEWCDVIQKRLGEETEILVDLVPAMGVFLPGKSKQHNDNTTTKTKKGENNKRSKRASSNDGDRQDCGITERAVRIQNVLVEFLRLVSTKEHPIVLLLDDVQWAQKSALGILDALLLERNFPHFFLLTTCRQEYLDIAENEEQHKNPSSKSDGHRWSMSSSELKQNMPLLDLLERHAANVQQVTIDVLDTASVQRVVNALLRLDDNDEGATETQALSEIVHRKTQGNPFFVLQFMNVLVSEKLLTFDWTTMKWDWLDGEIKHQQVAENVADVVMKRLSTLESQDLLILQIASCLGSSFESDTLEFVLLGLQARYQDEWRDTDWPGDELDARMQHLVDIGILEDQIEQFKYDFAHDQIQAAAFRLIPSDRKDPMRMSMGRRLIEGLDENHRDHYLFTAVNLCAAGVRIMSQIERSHLKFWAFVAGDAALKQGAFEAALRFFEKAIECLGSNNFAMDPELALPLFSGSAEAAYCLGCSADVENYIQIIQNADIPELEKIRISLIRLKVLSGRRDFGGCVESFRKTVKDLGVANFPKSPGVFGVLFELGKTARALKKHNSDTLLALPVCESPNIRRALSIEVASFYHLYLTNPNLCVVATCKAMQWTLEFGHSKASPAVMAQYATLIVGISKDYSTALELGEAGLELIELHGYKEALPMTVGFVFGFIRHWTKPMHDFLNPMRYAIDIGTRLGCMDDVAFLVNTFGLLLILTQTNTLATSIDEIEGFRHTMIETNHSDHLSFTECNLQFAQQMATRGSEESSLSGDVMEESAMLAVAAQNNDIALTGFVYYFKMMLNVYFGRPLIAADYGERNVGMGFKYGQGAHMVPRNTFFVGLSSILAYKVDGKSSRLMVARAMEKRIKSWVKSSNPNVLHFLHLLQAELLHVKSRFPAAQEAYTAAIKTSTRTGFKLDFALSNERLALFYADTSHPLHDLAQAQFYMTSALDAYRSYGALNKVRHMEHTYPLLLPKGSANSLAS